MHSIDFKPIEVGHLPELQSLIDHAGLRNCNFSAANLLSWQSLFKTSLAPLAGGFVVRYSFPQGYAYLLVPESDSAEAYSAMAQALVAGENQLLITALEERQARYLTETLGFGATATQIRDRQDYLYRRSDLETLYGRNFQAKRNHVNRFRSQYQDFRYINIGTRSAQQCLRFAEKWRLAQPDPDNPSIAHERESMEYVFGHWDSLPMMGGAIMVGDNMVAFTYGCAINSTTFDICIEKADYGYDGAYNVINQEFIRHLPEQYTVINREEDMGLEGLRNAKLSYNPAELLDFYAVEYHAEPLLDGVTLQRCREVDLSETAEWMVRQYGFRDEEVSDWLENLSIDWPLSVRAVDRDGRTIGLLTMSSYRIEQEAVTMPHENPELLARLNALRYTAVFSFIVAQDYRGSRLNYVMFKSIERDLLDYDFVFVPVLHRLKTHEYWKRWGARLFFQDENCKYYLLPISPKAKKLEL